MQFSFISGIGQPTTAIAYELFVIAAVVIGGGSLLGGEGSILGSLIGALIITILYMGGQQMGWPKWVQEIVIGGIIIAAVALDRIPPPGHDVIADCGPRFADLAVSNAISADSTIGIIRNRNFRTFELHR